MSSNLTVPEHPPHRSSRREGRRHRRRRQRILQFGAVVLVLAIVLGTAPAHRLINRTRSARLAAESAALLELNDLDGAQVRAQAALRLTPRDPVALRAMALALTQATNAAALQWWEQLLQTDRATGQDRRAYVELVIRTGDTSLAANEVQRLLADAPEEPANLWLAAQLATLRNEAAQALKYASQAATLAPTNRQYNLLLATLQFDAPEPAARELARSNLWARAGEPGSLGFQAQSFLARRKDLTPEQYARLITFLRQSAEPSTAQDLLALGLEMAAAPARRAELLNQALDRYRTAAPKDRVEFAVWLNQNGEFERTLAALPIAQARLRKAFFLPYLDALVALGRWEHVLNLLETKPMPLEPAYTHAYRAQSQSQLKNYRLAVMSWRLAASAARSNPEQLAWVAKFAEKCGALDTAKQAFRLLITCQKNPRPSFQELERLTRQSGSTLELRDLLAEMARRWPLEPALQNELAYLNLLLGEDPVPEHEKAESLLKDFPGSLAYRTTLALALWRERDFAGALAAYQGPPADWSQTLPSQRVVYAVVLAANDRTDEARQLARALPAEQLRPEELDLLKPLL